VCFVFVLGFFAFFVLIILKRFFECTGCVLEWVKLRGKPWSVDEERQLRLLVEEGKGFSEISQVMGKSRVSVKNKVYNLGLSLKDNAQLQIPFAVSSLSSLSSKAPIADSSSAVESAGVNEAVLEVGNRCAGALEGRFQIPKEGNDVGIKNPEGRK